MYFDRTNHSAQNYGYRCDKILSLGQKDADEGSGEVVLDGESGGVDGKIVGHRINLKVPCLHRYIADGAVSLICV